MKALKFRCGVVFIYTIAFVRCMDTTITRVGKMLIDVDVGGDDAMALLVALEAEKFDNSLKIIGITCVNGNTNVNQVALNVLKTLKVVDRLDIPVYIGASHPLLLPNKKDNYFGKDGLGDFDFSDPPSADLIQSKHGVNAMIDLVKAHPGEITLVALGPLTNIALAIRIYPSFLDELQHLIVMGGSTEGRGNSNPSIEFNFFADPVANYVVFSSSTSKPLILLPWETSMRTRTTTKFRLSLTKSNDTKSRFIDSIESLQQCQSDTEWFWPDAAAIAIALTSGSIVTKSGIYYSEAIYEGSKTTGMIIIDYTNITGNAGNTELIQGIDKIIYKEILLRTFIN